MTGDIISKISEQLGSYRDIQEKIQDMRRRIELLNEVQEAGGRKAGVSAELLPHKGNGAVCGYDGAAGEACGR